MIQNEIKMKQNKKGKPKNLKMNDFSNYCDKIKIKQ